MPVYTLDQLVYVIVSSVDEAGKVNLDLWLGTIKEICFVKNAGIVEVTYHIGYDIDQEVEYSESVVNQAVFADNIDALNQWGQLQALLNQYIIFNSHI